ncbi:MAG: class I SAM-dependent methyltransferase [Deltaproteobacteria bacterium]|nr:class I SAM-dependent methyltransferase [Deltaproteobacteria bacterium]
MGLYDRLVLPRLLDFAMRQKPISMQRQKVVPQAHGRVLEIGIGSGLNLAFYDRGRVAKLWGLEPSEPLRRIAHERARAAGIEVEFLGLPGEQIPLEDASVDTVVTTYTLCTIPGVERALGEMLRVLVPGGSLLFSEHGRAPDAGVARWQDRLDRIWGQVAGGCHLNRAIADLIGSAGFRMAETDTMYVPGPRPFTYTYWGRAQRD